MNWEQSEEDANKQIPSDGLMMKPKTKKVEVEGVRVGSDIWPRLDCNSRIFEFVF